MWLLPCATTRERYTTVCRHGKAASAKQPRLLLRRRPTLIVRPSDVSCTDTLREWDGRNTTAPTGCSGWVRRSAACEGGGSVPPGDTAGDTARGTLGGRVLQLAKRNDAHGFCEFCALTDPRPPPTHLCQLLVAIERVVDGALDDPGLARSRRPCSLFAQPLSLLLQLGKAPLRRRRAQEDEHRRYPADWANWAVAHTRSPFGGTWMDPSAAASPALHNTPPCRSTASPTSKRPPHRSYARCRRHEINHTSITGYVKRRQRDLNTSRCLAVQQPEFSPNLHNKTWSTSMLLVSIRANIHDAGLKTLQADGTS